MSHERGKWVPEINAGNDFAVEPLDVAQDVAQLDRSRRLGDLWRRLSLIGYTDPKERSQILREIGDLGGLIRDPYSPVSRFGGEISKPRKR